MDEIKYLKNSLPEIGLQAVHKRWAIYAARRLRFIHPDLSMRLYESGWKFTLHVNNYSGKNFLELAEFFDRSVRPITCNISLSQELPQDCALVEERDSYEAELWLNGDPLSVGHFNNLLAIAEPALPAGSIDFDQDRNTWVFKSVTSLSDNEKACVQGAMKKAGIIDSVEFLEVQPEAELGIAQEKPLQIQGDISLVTSRQFNSAPSWFKRLLERDEDEWRGFLSRRAKQEVIEPDLGSAQEFSCLYDIEHCADSRLSELLTIYDRVDVMPPANGGLDWCAKHQIPLDDLQELARLKRVRLILPHSLDSYPSKLIESVAEVGQSSLVLSRALAVKTIVQGQKKEPLLYAPLTSGQRSALLFALLQSVVNEKYRGLLKSYGQLFSGQHDLFMMRGALASLGFGVGAYLGDVFLKLGSQDARLELMTCGAGIEWALGLGASYIPRSFGEYDETRNSEIVASYLGRTKLQQSDPVANRMHMVSDGLLAISGIPPLEVAKNFHSLPIARFRDLARRLMASFPNDSELQNAIEQINVEVKSFERRSERLASWKLSSPVTGMAVGLMQESFEIGVATSAISSWLYEILKDRIPHKFQNELVDVKHMLIGLATGSSLDAVVVSRSRKAIAKK